jgi:hypothetical protein
MNVMRAQSAANIEATPNPVPYGERAGATTISWNTGDGSPGQVYMSKDSGPEQLFAEGAKGSQDAAWISIGVTYEFRLYSGMERRTPVAVVSVTQTDPPWDLVSNALLHYAHKEERLDDVARLVARIMRGYAHPVLYEQYFRLWEEHGFHLTPVHFYQPIPDTRTLTDELWAKESELVGMEMNDAVQLELLQRAFPRFRAEYDRFPMDPTDNPYEYYFNNGQFGGTDALGLYCMVRHFDPNLIIEVGSGFSTRVSAQAAMENRHTKLVCIEPHATEPIRHDIFRTDLPGLVALISKRVEEVGVDLFQDLGPNDILFIDTSHVAKIGGDVNFVFLEIIPRLKPGVIVHVHDIFFPLEYPRGWVMDSLRFYNEQYLLQGFLAFNSAYEVLLCNSYLGHKYHDELKATFPNSPWWGGGSFWMRRRLA